MSERSTILTERDIIRSVPGRYHAAYDNYKSRAGGRWPSDVSAELDALDVETCTREAVDEIIGNTTWTRNLCDSCGHHAKTLIRLGDEPEYDARWQDICLECLEAAVSTLRAAT